MAARKHTLPVNHKVVSEALNYDPETGSLTWAKPLSNVVKKGDEAGFNHSYGYRVVSVRNVQYLAHRVIWAIQTQKDTPAHLVIDHKNGNPADNRWCNLRIGTQRDNTCNSKRQAGSSGVRGVRWVARLNKWHARISVDNRERYLGIFKTKQEAVDARLAAEREFYGEYCFRSSRGIT